MELNSGLPAGHIGIEVQIETARGLINVEEICAASPRLEAVVFGPADFAASVEMPVLTGGIQIEEYPGDHFHYVLQQDIDGRAGERDPGDRRPVSQDPRAGDVAGLLPAGARSLGYDGKWALHPDQVAILNEVFSPTQEQFDRAWAILDAYEKATEQATGAVMFGEEMIDEASRKMALKFVSRGERAGLVRSGPGRA